MLSLIYPKKCILCKSILPKQLPHLCENCRSQTPEFSRAKRNIPFVAQWTALWYYKDTVRSSVHRFKFGRTRCYAEAYAAMLAVKLAKVYENTYDLISWVPVSTLRRLDRGFDQSELIARSLGGKLNQKAVRTLYKIRHTPPQSSILDAAQRRANVQGAYRASDKDLIAGKRILLIDDVVTTGATASECARTLLTAGAKEVFFAAVAAADYHKK